MSEPKPVEEHIDIETEAKAIAKFFNTLLMEQVPQNVAKALAIAYVESFKRRME